MERSCAVHRQPRCRLPMPSWCDCRAEAWLPLLLTMRSCLAVLLSACHPAPRRHQAEHALSLPSKNVVASCVRCWASATAVSIQSWAGGSRKRPRVVVNQQVRAGVVHVRLLQVTVQHCPSSDSGG